MKGKSIAWLSKRARNDFRQHAYRMNKALILVDYISGTQTWTVIAPAGPRKETNRSYVCVHFYIPIYTLSESLQIRANVLEYEYQDSPSFYDMYEQEQNHPDLGFLLHRICV